MGSIGTANGNGIGHGGAAVARRQHAEGPAAMLGIGTANPTGVEVPQNVFAENLFRVTKSDHLTELQQKLTRICTTAMFTPVHHVRLQYNLHACMHVFSCYR